MGLAESMRLVHSCIFFSSDVCHIISPLQRSIDRCRIVSYRVVSYHTCTIVQYRRVWVCRALVMCFLGSQKNSQAAGPAPFDQFSRQDKTRKHTIVSDRACVCSLVMAYSDLCGSVLGQGEDGGGLGRTGRRQRRAAEERFEGGRTAEAPVRGTVGR